MASLRRSSPVPGHQMALLLASRISQAGLSYFLSCFVLLKYQPVHSYRAPSYLRNEARRSDRNKCWMRAFAQGPDPCLSPFYCSSNIFTLLGAPQRCACRMHQLLVQATVQLACHSSDRAVAGTGLEDTAIEGALCSLARLLQRRALGRRCTRKPRQKARAGSKARAQTPLSMVKIGR